MRETTNGDLDYVDGYDEMPAEFQEKIKRALDQGHIDDEDWKGVIVSDTNPIQFTYLQCTRMLSATGQVRKVSARQHPRKRKEPRT